MDNYDIIVIGAGPAGYISAIRCAQLGMKTACVDDRIGKQGEPVLGGTCLNVGCIPSKSLLESSALYEKIRDGAAEHGIVTCEVTHDVDAMVANKDRIVQDLTGGIETLFRSNGVKWLQGRGQLLPGRQVRVTRHDGSVQTLDAANVILATGSAPMARRGGEECGTAVDRTKPRACDDPRTESFLFDDPYWDDAFDSYHDPTLRTCCRR